MPVCVHTDWVSCALSRHTGPETEFVDTSSPLTSVVQALTVLPIGKCSTAAPQVAFLFTDAHVADKGFLEPVNSMLTTGMPAGLFDDAEKDALTAGLRDEVRPPAVHPTRATQHTPCIAPRARRQHSCVKSLRPCAAGMTQGRCAATMPSARMEHAWRHAGACPGAQAVARGAAATPESLWAAYAARCRDNLHVVLAMSPVGEPLRARCRNFAGLATSTVIDWFQPWPEQALRSVATAQLQARRAGIRRAALCTVQLEERSMRCAQCACAAVRGCACRDTGS